MQIQNHSFNFPKSTRKPLFFFLCCYNDKSQFLFIFFSLLALNAKWNLTQGISRFGDVGRLEPAAGISGLLWAGPGSEG